MPSTTTLGTPRAESWDDTWLAFVDETEQRLGRAICGAHAPDGEPCELGSTHPNGRCRFHGGHPRIGAQPGNSNALIHGLYSRRLRQCNNTCPAWHLCPFAGPDVTALSERKRPVCAYEREAYAIAMRIPDMEWSPTANVADTALSAENHTTSSGAGVPAREASTEASALRNLPFAFHKPNQTPREGIITHLQYRATPFFGRRGATTKFPRNPDGSVPADDTSLPSFPSTPPPDPAPAMIDDTAAILYAMLQRATLTVSTHHLTEKTEAEGERYSMRSTKMSAALTTFLRIGRELRAWLRLRPEPTTTANASPGFGDDLERPSTTKDGYAQFYDHQGNKQTLAALMHPFLNELDAAVEQLRKEGIKIPAPEPIHH